MLKRIDEPRLLAGFFREALFHSRIVRIDCGDVSFTATILNLEEDSARARDSKRILVLKPETGLLERLDRVSLTTFQYRCNFPHFVAKWESPEAELVDAIIRMPLPVSLLVEDRRSARRTDVTQITRLAVPVLVQTHGMHTDGVLSVEDISSLGVGGRLMLAAPIPVDTTTTIVGESHKVEGSFRVAGRVKTAELDQASGSPKDDSTYRVGLKQTIISSDGSEMPGPGVLPWNGPERRTMRRVKTDFALRVHSPFNPAHVIELEVLDASVTGFAATLLDQSDRALLPLGCGVSLADSTLVAELVAMDEQIIRFAIIRGTVEDRLAWLKRLSRYQLENLHLSSAVGEDILRLFCEAGAVSSGFLKNQAKMADEIVRGFGSTTGEEGWLHRWIERTPTGEIKGHIGAVRLGDSLWHFGDLAGSISGGKIDASFIPKFFTCFQEYCYTLTPCPRIILAWNKGHPYWQGLSDSIKAATVGGNDLAVFETAYVRFAKLPDKPDAATWESREIKPWNHSEIIELTMGAPATARLLLAGLDFSVETFGSPRLTEMLRCDAHVFRRNYVLLSKNASKFLLIAQSFPVGTSPNRSMDVAWLIPLFGTYTGSLSEYPIHPAQKYLVREGYSSPGILIFSGSEPSAVDCTKRMIWCVGHPRAVDYFRSRLK